MTRNSQTRRLPGRLLTLFRVLFTFCLLATVLFIFSNSADLGEVSGGKSAAVTELVNKAMERLGFGYRFTEHRIRKLAHFSEYMLLGFWLMLTLRVYTHRIVSFVAWPLLGGLLTAVGDEFYQTFIPGRAGQVSDVVIDFAGVSAGLLAGLFALLLAGAIWDAFHGRR